VDAQRVRTRDGVELVIRQVRPDDKRRSRRASSDSVVRYVRGAEPHLAEVSVAVGDLWQHSGVATELLEHLVERAREAQITHFVALVLDENVEAIKLFEHWVPGHAQPGRSASGHLELLIELPEPGRPPDSALARVLRLVAHRAVTVNPYRVTREAIRRLRGE
jgi:hypothetical protein